MKDSSLSQLPQFTIEVIPYFEGLVVMVKFSYNALEKMEKNEVANKFKIIFKDLKSELLSVSSIYVTQSSRLRYIRQLSDNLEEDN